MAAAGVSDAPWGLSRWHAGSDRSGADEEGPARSIACLLRDGQATPPGHGLYLMAGSKPGIRPGTAGARGSGVSGMPGPVLRLVDLAHLDAGDMIYVPCGDRPPGHRAVEELRSAQRPAGLTEQCDNYCLMCSQPPKDRDDAWLFDRARKVISLLPQDQGLSA